MADKKYRHILPLSAIAVLAGIFVYFYFYCQFWTHLNTENFESLVEYRGKHVKGHRGRQVLVNQDFFCIIDKVNDYAERNNLKILITQSYRSPQKKLTKTVVPPATKSNHLAGHAIDINLICRGKVYESRDLMKDNHVNLPENIKGFIRSIGLDETIRWGGDFYTEDPVHIDDGLNKSNMKNWERQYYRCQKDYINAEPKWISRLTRLFR